MDEARPAGTARAKEKRPISFQQVGVVQVQKSKVCGEPALCQRLLVSPDNFPNPCVCYSEHTTSPGKILRFLVAGSLLDIEPTGHRT
jgi:hypothetical protein